MVAVFRQHLWIWETKWSSSAPPFLPHFFEGEKLLSFPDSLTCKLFSSFFLHFITPSLLSHPSSHKKKSELLVLDGLYPCGLYGTLIMEAKRSVREFTMTLEAALASNELPAFLVYDTISATPLHSSTTSFLLDNAGDGVSMMGDLESPDSRSIATAPMRRKRRRRTRTCKNKEAAETQRMTHIAVERNRRRQMNEHLTSLRSLMPESYIQRGDQASIVGGAIDFVKELEQLLQSLEAQKRASRQKQREKGGRKHSVEVDDSTGGSSSSNTSIDDTDQPPFAQFFAYPQYNWCHARREYPPLPKSRPALADIEVTLIETHANIRILSPRRPRQLLKMVAGLQTLRLTILHLNVTTLDSMVLYSLNAKVEEGCNLTTVDGIADAVHHILALIEAETVSDLSQ